MKVVYLVSNPGIVSRTPAGWSSAVLTAGPDGRWPDEDLRQLEDADFLVVGLEPVGEEIFRRTGRLKLVQRLGRGYENVDLEAAARHGIPVCTMPDFNAAAVAEHAFMLMLALAKRLFESTLLMKAGRWPAREVVGRGVYDVAGKTLGIVGLGAIGREVAGRARAFAMPVVYYDTRAPSPEVADALEVEEASLEGLLAESDIVTLHLPLLPETRRIIGRRELARMKKTALLINTARGALVDEEALAEALEQGTIAGAGLDVFSREPWEGPHPLRQCPNVILTPHLAGQTREAMERMVAVMLENLDRVADGREPLYRLEGSE